MVVSGSGMKFVAVLVATIVQFLAFSAAATRFAEP